MDIWRTTYYHYGFASGDYRLGKLNGTTPWLQDLSESEQRHYRLATMNCFRINIRCRKTAIFCWHFRGCLLLPDAIVKRLSSDRSQDRATEYARPRLFIIRISGYVRHLLVSCHMFLTGVVMSKVYIGGCLCGSIRFTASSPNNSHTCSCDICRKHTGAPTVVWIEFDAENVEWTGKAGKPTTRRSSETTSRAFCPQCGSSVGAIDDAPVICAFSRRF